MPLPFNLNLAAPSNSAANLSVDGRSAFDASGWTVATGGGRAAGGTSGGMRQAGFTAPAHRLGSAVAPQVPALPMTMPSWQADEYGMPPQYNAPAQAGGGSMLLMVAAAALFFLRR